MSCGIGDTDGFPAFDVESDDYDCKDDTKWGFLITGGAEFHMPLTVFQVSECSSSSSNSSCPYSLLTFASLPPAHVLFLPHGWLWLRTRATDCLVASRGNCLSMAQATPCPCLPPGGSCNIRFVIGATFWSRARKRFGYDEIIANGRNEYFTLRCDNCRLRKRAREKASGGGGGEGEGEWEWDEAEGDACIAKCSGESREPLVHTIFGLALFCSVQFCSFLICPLYFSSTFFSLGLCIQYCFPFWRLPENWRLQNINCSPVCALQMGHKRFDDWCGSSRTKAQREATKRKKQTDGGVDKGESCVKRKGNRIWNWNWEFELKVCE